MAHSTSRRRAARQAYVDGGSLKIVADQIGVAESTVRRWRTASKKRGDDWDNARAASSLTGRSREELVRRLMTDFLSLHEDAIQGVREADIDPITKADLLAKLSDAIVKTSNALTKAAPKLSALGIAQEILSHLADYTAQHYPAYAEIIQELIPAFGEEILKRYQS